MMVMNSGWIIHNGAVRGGGIYSYHGWVVMNDGSITENQAMWGGGIYRDDIIFEVLGTADKRSYQELAPWQL